MSWHARIATVAREKGKEQVRKHSCFPPLPHKRSISTIQAPHILACMVPIA